MLLAGRQAFLIAFVTCVVNFLRVFPFNYNRNQQDCGYFATQIKMGPSATRVTHCNQLSHFYVHSNVFSVCLYAPTLSQKLISLVPLVKKKTPTISSKFMTWVWYPGLDKELGFSPVVIDFTQHQTKMVFCRQKLTPSHDEMCEFLTGISSSCC